MSSRPRAGRGAAGRDGNREADQENELYTRVIEGLNKANEEHKICKALQEEAFALEQEIKDDGGKPTLAQHQRLDTIYRDLLKHSEEEKKIQDEWNIVDSLAMISAMKASEEPPSRNGPIPKSRKHQRPAVDSDGAPDSPGPSPSETRSDLLKRVKGTGQRSSSVASARSAVAPKSDELTAETNRGVVAERAGQLVVGTEVFYKFPKGSAEDLGAGIQCHIKKVWQDKKP